ncbi:hypothetical protein SBA2_210015 [Acidobacteriia bacterium SbA2]|nr:hypothetical protein SBA2_210015 [Acidobacteriia bacterium SbA2]
MAGTVPTAPATVKASKPKAAARERMLSPIVHLGRAFDKQNRAVRASPGALQEKALDKLCLIR